jgi:hypothetical protein
MGIASMLPFQFYLSYREASCIRKLLAIQVCVIIPLSKIPSDATFKNLKFVRHETKFWHNLIIFNAIKCFIMFFAVIICPFSVWNFSTDLSTDFGWLSSSSIKVSLLWNVLGSWVTKWVGAVWMAGVWFPIRADISFFTTTNKLILEPIQPSVQCVPMEGLPFSQVRRSKRDYKPQFSAEV